MEEELLFMDDMTEVRELYHPSRWNDKMTSHSVQFQGRSSLGGPGPGLSPFSDAGFLPDWNCGSPNDQLFSQSPTVEVLQESIWLESTDDFSPGLQWFSGTSPKQRHASSDDDLLKVVSPEDVIVASHERDGQASGGDGLRLADAELVATDSESLLENLISQPLSIEDETNEVTGLSFPNESELRCFAAGVDKNGTVDVDSGGRSSSAVHTSQQLLTINAEQCQNEVGILQEVPDCCVTPVEFVDLDCQSLQDPESVFDILRELVRGSTGFVGMKYSLISEPVLSPVSSEEVDTILSLDGMDSSEEVPVEVVPAIADRFSTLSEKQLRQTFSLSDSLSVQSSNGATIFDEYLQQPLSTKSEASSSCRSTLISRPYIKETRREKKKEQNKNAAVRYRQKKRQEKGVVLTEVDKLELKNAELKSKLDDLNREIGYLRELLDEINRQ